MDVELDDVEAAVERWAAFLMEPEAATSAEPAGVGAKAAAVATSGAEPEPELEPELEPEPEPTAET